ncbi:hypothetical protein B0H14DRAFT_2603344 [Mycena olivaceomarginata]|nr:hypothetical protein B0H14DRAFT_2603344 [Mycena olivaceomarginata]
MAFSNVALSLAKQTKDINLILHTMLRRGKIAYDLCDPAAMINLVKEACSLIQLTNTHWKLKWLETEAEANLVLGNLSQAQELVEQCYAQIVANGLEDSITILATFDMQIDVCVKRTEYLEAKEICDIAVAKTSTTRAPLFHGHFLVQRAYVGILTTGNRSEILLDLNAAEAVYTQLASPNILLCSWARAVLELYGGNHQKAHSAFKECLSKSLGCYPDITSLCLAALGDPNHQMDIAWNTLCWAMTYFALTWKMNDLVATLHALHQLADLFAGFNDQETALNLFHISFEGATNLGIHRLCAECMGGIGDIMKCHGNIVEAKEMWEAANPLFIRSSQTKDAAAIEACLAKLTLAQDHQEKKIDYPVVVTDVQATANQQESKKLGQLPLLSAPQDSPSTVAEGSMSANGPESNATGAGAHKVPVPI